MLKDTDFLRQSFYTVFESEQTPTATGFLVYENIKGKTT